MTIEDDSRVSIDARPVAKFALFAAKEWGEWDTYLPEGIELDDVFDHITIGNAEHVAASDGTVFVEGKAIVQQAVDKIPAGPIKNGRAVNPPEVITEDREVQFLTALDLGEGINVETRVEA